MRIRVLPYKPGSRTARSVATALGGKRLRLGNESKFVPRPDDFIINWGNGWNVPPRLDNEDVPWVNKPSKVRVASNKLTALFTFQELGVNSPNFTIDKEIAASWNFPFIARSKLNGCGGTDAMYIDPSDGPVPLNGFVLFTEYVKKKTEYRVHVVDGEVVDVQQKRKRNGMEADFKIRNHARGWVFCRYDIDQPDPQVYEYALAAVDVLGLDFGAVDIIWNEHHRAAYVLEVNTAPGLEATTFDRYVNKFKGMING